MANDTLSDFYAPIVQIQNGLLYSNSFLSSILTMWTFFVRIFLIWNTQDFSANWDVLICWDINNFCRLCLLSQSGKCVVYHYCKVFLALVCIASYSIFQLLRMAKNYFLCIYPILRVNYHKHDSLLPRSFDTNLRGRQLLFSGLPFSIQAFLPAELNWVTNKTSFIFLRPEKNAVYANCGKVTGEMA